MTLISLLGSAYKHSSSPLLVLSGGTRLPPPAARGARKYNDRVSCYLVHTRTNKSSRSEINDDKRYATYTK